PEYGLGRPMNLACSSSEIPSDGSPDRSHKFPKFSSLRLLVRPSPASF
ncbi:hypothetical protein A2U01_0118863, partial [Trifolium medium]|nr:hypothetical protein [Trifolium medium]